MVARLQQHTLILLLSLLPRGSKHLQCHRSGGSCAPIHITSTQYTVTSIYREGWRDKMKDRQTDRWRLTIISNGSSSKSQHDKFCNSSSEECLLVKRREVLKPTHLRLSPLKHWANPQTQGIKYFLQLCLREKSGCMYVHKVKVQRSKYTHTHTHTHIRLPHRNFTKKGSCMLKFQREEEEGDISPNIRCFLPCCLSDHFTYTYPGNSSAHLWTWSCQEWGWTWQNPEHFSCHRCHGRRPLGYRAGKDPW